MIHALAVFYVNILEPALKVLAVVFAIVFVLYVFNLLRGGDKKNDIITVVVNGMVKMIVKSVQLVGKSIVTSVKVLLAASRVIFATLRDFLTSKI